MKDEIIKQLDGYNDIVKEIEISRKYGTDFSLEKGMVEKYINLLHPKRMELRVSDIIEETPSSKTLRLVSTNNYLPPFQAGQYIALYLEIGNIRTSRPYSISSQPNQTGYYDITLRRVERGLVSPFLLDRVKRGDILESSGPEGTFYYNPLVHDKTMVCLAGGSGITPFMSMIREIVDCGLDRTVYLLYGNNSTDDIIFHDELSRISGRFDNIKYIPVIENPPDGYTGRCGYITGDIIREELGDVGGKTFFLCGPQAMYDFCLPEIEKLNIPRRKIRKEMYGAPDNIWEYPGWPPEVKRDDEFKVKVSGSKPFKAVASEPLLSSLEKHGIVIPSLCRSGECSMCRLKLISGKVFQPQGTPVRKSDRQFGYIHSCVSYPIEDLELLL
jgi:ferredoxin-NADP reductase/ferredoxin